MPCGGVCLSAIPAVTFSQTAYGVTISQTDDTLGT